MPNLMSLIMAPTPRGLVMNTLSLPQQRIRLRGTNPQSPESLPRHDLRAQPRVAIRAAIPPWRRTWFGNGFLTPLDPSSPVRVPQRGRPLKPPCSENMCVLDAVAHGTNGLP